MLHQITPGFCQVKGAAKGAVAACVLLHVASRVTSLANASMGQHFATVLHSSSRVLLQPDLHSDQTRDGQRLQWRADGSSMRALDSMTETETHHNDGAVSVACDQSQIESLSVARVPLIYISRRAKQKATLPPVI